VIGTLRPSLSFSQLFVRAAVPLSILLALVVGWELVHHRRWVEITVALLSMIPLLFSSRVRLLFLVLGGLLVFHSSTQLTPQKLYFFVAASVAVAGALGRMRWYTGDPIRRDLRPMLVASRVFAVLILVSLITSIAFATPHKPWLRDVIPYLLMVSVPIIAFDAQTAYSTSALRRILVLAGLLGTAAFAAQWLSNRHILNISAFGLPTFFLGGALFSYAMAVVLEGERHRIRWLLVAAVILAALLATGTRSSLILLAAPIAIAFGARRHFTRRWVRLAVVLPAAALLVLAGIVAVVDLTGASRNVLQTRINLVGQTGGSSDQSYQSRLTQGRAGWDLFKRDPIFGVGPGYPVSWIAPDGTVQTAPAIDSPIEYLVKFGLFGLWALFVFVWAVWRTLAQLRRRTGGRTVSQLALIGFGGIFVVWWALGVPFDDKGFASGCILLLALALREASLFARRAEVPW
jgi:O-antigen ligase